MKRLNIKALIRRMQNVFLLIKNIPFTRGDERIYLLGGVILFFLSMLMLKYISGYAWKILGGCLYTVSIGLIQWYFYIANKSLWLGGVFGLLIAFIFSITIMGFEHIAASIYLYVLVSGMIFFGITLAYMMEYYKGNFRGAMIVIAAWFVLFSFWNVLMEYIAIYYVQEDWQYLMQKICAISYQLANVVGIGGFFAYVHNNGK